MGENILAVDLFCGAGGMTFGLRSAGIKVIAGIDFDPSVQFSFEKNNNTQFIQGDLTNFPPQKIRRLFPKTSLKILVGCAPCQPFSTHSQKVRKKPEDGRWRLLDSFYRVVSNCKPDVVSMENVPSLAKHKIFKKFVKNLIENDYHVFFDVLDSVNSGVPQFRKRLVLLASRLGPISFQYPKASLTFKTVRSAIEKLEPLCAGGVSSRDPLHRAASLSAINLERIRVSKPGGTWRDWPRHLHLPCHKKEGGEKYPSVYGRMEWDKPAPTITTQFHTFGTGRYGHPTQNRAISLREGAILQGFPKSYQFWNPDTEFSIQKIATQIGNAVPIGLSASVGQNIIRHLKSVS